MNIKSLNQEYLNEWKKMRIELWPETSEVEHEEEMRIISSGEFFEDELEWSVYFAEEDNKLIGFIESSLRKSVKGCENSPIGYIEGWYIDEKYRERGVGKQLVLKAESWAMEKGSKEMASDIEFENKISATFNLCAFTEECTRTIKLMFAYGEVGGNHMKNIIDVHKFGDNSHKVIHPKVNKSGHGGGDYSLMKDFISLITSNERELKTGAIQSVESHIIAFAAEYSRLNYKVVNIDEFYENAKNNI